jgi:hypothetical protein
MMDKVQKPSNPECHAPSSEPFRINQILVLLLSFGKGKEKGKAIPVTGHGGP